MEFEQNDLLLLKTISLCNDNGVSCSDIRIQKILYLVSIKKDLTYNFVMYKNGPHSFELQDDITKLKAYMIIRETYKSNLIGLSIYNKDIKNELINSTLEKDLSDKLENIFNLVKELSVKQLEELTTKLFFERNQNQIEKNNIIFSIFKYSHPSIIDQNNSDYESCLKDKECKISYDKFSESFISNDSIFENITKRLLIKTI